MNAHSTADHGAFSSEKSKGKEFLIKEYEALRHQMDQFSKEIINMERWALIVSGAIWSWLATQGYASTPPLIFGSPATMTALLGLRSLGLHNTNILAGKYIFEIEKRFGVQIYGFGWEHKMHSKRPIVSFLAGYLFWGILITSNVAIPYLYIPSLK